MTSWISFGSTPDFFNKPLIAVAPSWGAVRLANEPPKLPIGVLAVDIIYTSFIKLKA
jgi:hypothetical protein